MTESELLDRITVRADVFGGKPIIRDMRIAVEHVLAMLAAGEEPDTILSEYPALEPEDIQACLLFARREKEACGDRLSSASGAIDPRVLDAIVRRVVEVARPERIILFGSAARGKMTRHSDVDLLVIADVENRSAVTGRIHRRLRGEHAAVDVVVVTPADVARYGDSHALIIKPALQEGRVVYEAP